jgi:integrase/recombinase XerD
MRTFSETELQAILKGIDTKTPLGFRVYTIVCLYVDTTCRLSEATGLDLEDVDLAAGRAKVMGKGRRERYVFSGANLRKLIWKYVNLYRPEPASPSINNLFLTKDGRPLSRSRVEAIVRKYCLKAGLKGVRLSPHTLRHTACLMWVKKGGDLFSLQALTGHSSLNVLRGYVNLDTEAIQTVHRRYSPIDNLTL